MQQNQLEQMRAQLEREKQASAERLQILEHQLHVWEAEREHEMAMEELRLKYHTVASGEKMKQIELGETDERKDAFKNITGALLEAIQSRRGLPKPPQGAA